MKTEKQYLNYQDHLTDQWYAVEAPTHRTKEEIKMMRDILMIYSKYGVPDFKNYKPITFTTCQFDDDDNEIDNSDYETPLISMHGFQLEFEDVSTDLDSIDDESLANLLSIMEEFCKSEDLLADKQRSAAHQLIIEEQKERLLDLIPQCKSVKLKKVLLKIYNRCVNEDIEVYVDDQTDYKFDVELEEDFDENILSYLEEGEINEKLEIDGWNDAPLDADFAKLLSGWKWKNIMLKNGNYVIVYREGEDWDEETYYIGTFSPQNLLDGQIEMKAWGLTSPCSEQ